MILRVVDARGLKCPLPVMKAAKALREMAAGEVLRVLSTDPGAPQDFADFCASRGHELVDSREAEGAFEFVIRARG
jgi:tRNA 2-thiouridine synthesizing protein A